jgi:lipopolysaccharide export system permease protein
MKTVRRLLYGDILSSVLFVAAAFLSLFFFIDVVDSLEDVGRDGLGVGHVVLGAVYLLPGHLYELMPIAVLIGSIYALARMAQSSEFTILRTGGLGPGRALGLLAMLGLVFAAFTFVVGDYLTPASERQAVLLKARAAGGLKVGGAGAWLKERRSGPEGERSFSINLQGTGPGGQLLGVRIFEFDADGRLRQRLSARTATVDDQGHWTLQDVDTTRWPQPATARPSAKASHSAAASAPAADEPVQQAHHDTLAWPSTLKPAVVAAAVLPLETMTTLDLWRYSQHLDVQAQAAQTHQIRFWRKALYPLACLVMVALALPFAYLHARAGGVSLKVFGGILLGISFVLLNNVAGHLGLLRGWTPWVAAATPSLLYLLMSLAAFAWLVRFR